MRGYLFTSQQHRFSHAGKLELGGSDWKIGIAHTEKHHAIQFYLIETSTVRSRETQNAHEGNLRMQEGEPKNENFDPLKLAVPPPAVRGQQDMLAIFLQCWQCLLFRLGLRLGRATCHDRKCACPENLTPQLGTWPFELPNAALQLPRQVARTSPDLPVVLARGAAKLSRTLPDDSDFSVLFLAQQ